MTATSLVSLFRSIVGSWQPFGPDENHLIWQEKRTAKAILARSLAAFSSGLPVEKNRAACRPGYEVVSQNKIA